MKKDSIDIILENQSLKSEFSIRGLDLDQVFYETPDDIKRENRLLINLLDWVTEYNLCQDRKEMEAQGYLFPPISPNIDPDNDWFRFKRWLKGEPIRQKLGDLLPVDFIPRDPKNLSCNEITSILNELSELLYEIHFSIDYIEDVPALLKYQYLLENLEDEFDIIEDGYWHLDGCSGYCPGCFQRPWCDSGNKSCWSEDEEAGEMYLTEMVKKYVNASSVSLQILQKFQAEEDKNFEEFLKNPDEKNNEIDLPF